MGDPEDPHDESYLRETSVRTRFIYRTSKMFFIKNIPLYLFQRRGVKENLEQTLESQEEAAVPTAAGDEEVIVDAIDSTPNALGARDLDAPRDFVVGPQQLLGLDHAVLQSIDRCRKRIFQMFLTNLTCKLTKVIIDKYF